MTALRCSHLRCHRSEWNGGPACVHDITLAFTEARLHGITGPPRSGKTLLLHLLGLLDEPDFGTIELFGERVSPAPETERREIRNAVFGYVFTSPCLLGEFSVAENVAMPLFRLSRANEQTAQMRVYELLARLGIEDVANDPVSTLDADQQFLVALARAVVHRPRILLLVEPSRPDILAVPTRRLVEALGITAIWAGPAGPWAAQCHHEVGLEHGCLISDSASVHE